MRRSLPLLAIAVIVAYVRIVAGGKTWDDVRYHTEIAPPRMAAAASMQDAAWPAWWESSALGVPLAAEPSHGAAYPPVWFGATPRALDLLWIAHLAWCALGVALWARRRGASELAAVTAGLLAGTAGLFASAAVRGALPGIAQLPWIGAIEHPLGVAVLIGAAGLSGSPAALVAAIAIAVAGRKYVPIVGGVAIAAIQWLPALALGDVVGPHAHWLSLARVPDLLAPGSGGDWPSLYVGAALIALAALHRGTLRIAVLLAGLGVAAFACPLDGEVLLAACALVAAAQAGRGIDAVLAGERRAAWALAAAAAATVIALGVAQRAIADGLIGAACLFAAAAVTWRWPGRVVVLALVVAPSIGALRVNAPLTDREIVDRRPAWAGEPGRLYRPRQLLDMPDDLETAIATLAGTSGARWGITAARSDDPARPAAYDAVWLAASRGGDALLSRFGITLAVLPVQPGAARLGERGPWMLVAFPAAPAAAVILDWRWSSRVEDVFAAPSVVLAGAGMHNEEAAGPPQPCAIDRWDPGAIDLTCTAAEPAYAVISSTAAPGWTATVDDRDASWLHADAIRRAVALPAGTHHVAWRYRARGLRPALVIAACGLALVILLRRRGRASRATT